jgi:hypothetical protein
MAAASPGGDSDAAQLLPPVVDGDNDAWTTTHVWKLDRCACVATRKALSHAQATLTPPARRSFSTLWTRGKKHFSEVFFVGGCPWRLSLYPRCATCNAPRRLLRFRPRRDGRSARCVRDAACRCAWRTHPRALPPPPRRVARS